MTKPKIYSISNASSNVSYFDLFPQEIKMLTNDGLCVLTKANSSKLHSLLLADNDLISLLRSHPSYHKNKHNADVLERLNFGLNNSQVVISNLDWRWLVDDLNKFTDAQLPYDDMVFEFLINSYHAIAHLTQRSLPGETLSKHAVGFTVYVMISNDQWITLDHDTPGLSHICAGAVDQAFGTITAMELDELISLVKYQVPDKINKKRIKSGKPPLRDHYILDLKPRHKNSTQETISGNELKTRMRAHFRRGHWRKLTDRDECIWVRWCIAGDPNLGFINKMYRL